MTTLTVLIAALTVLVITLAIFVIVLTALVAALTVISHLALPTLLTVISLISFRTLGSLRTPRAILEDRRSLRCHFLLSRTSGNISSSRRFLFLRCRLHRCCRILSIFIIFCRHFCAAGTFRRLTKAIDQFCFSQAADIPDSLALCQLF